MPSLSSIRCLFRGHTRDVASVRKADGVYTGRCEQCGVRLTKAGRDGVWRTESSGSARRGRKGTGDVTSPERSAMLQTGLTGVGVLLALLTAAAAVGAAIAPHDLQLRTAGSGVSTLELWKQQHLSRSRQSAEP